MTYEDLKKVWKPWLSLGLFVLVIVLSLTLNWEGKYSIVLGVGAS